MTLLLQVVSSHPVFADLVTRVVSRDFSLRKRFPKGSGDAYLVPEEHQNPRLFLLDQCSISDEPWQICCRLRKQYPGSKFLCMLPSAPNIEEEMLRLVYAGMDGLICLHEEWERELRRAIRSVLRGEFWVPRSVLERYVRQTTRMLAPVGPTDNTLTPREIQLVNLVVRRFSNREISGMLSISERTVKFHVSNVFHKTGIQSRDQLFAYIATEFPHSDASLPFPAAVPRQNSGLL